MKDRFSLLGSIFAATLVANTPSAFAAPDTANPFASSMTSTDAGLMVADDMTLFSSAISAAKLTFSATTTQLNSTFDGASPNLVTEASSLFRGSELLFFSVEDFDLAGIFADCILLGGDSAAGCSQEMFLSITVPPSSKSTREQLCPDIPGETAAEQLAHEREELLDAVFEFITTRLIILDPVKQSQIENQAEKIRNLIKDGPADWNVVMTEVVNLKKMLNALKPGDIGKPNNKWTDAAYQQYVNWLIEADKRTVKAFNNIVCLLKIVSKDKQDDLALQSATISLYNFLDQIAHMRGVDGEDAAMKLAEKIMQILEKKPVDYAALLKLLGELDDALAALDKAWANSKLPFLISPYKNADGTYPDPADERKEQQKKIEETRKRLSELRQIVQRLYWSVAGIRVD